MIYVTHDQVEAMTLADKIVLLNSGDAMQKEGSVAQIGKPLDLYHRPANLFVAGFIGSPTMNLLSATIAAAGHDRAEVLLGDGTRLAAAVDARAAKPGDKVTLGIRPEHLELGRGIEGAIVVEGRASHVEQLGEASYLYLEVAAVDGFVTVRQDGDISVGPGETVSTVLPEQHCHLFDAAGRAFPRLLRGKGAERALAVAGAGS